MSIKSSVNNQPVIIKPKPFPKLMYSPHSGSVFLFSDERKAVLIHSNMGVLPGSYFDNIDQFRHHYKDFEGTLTLQNE